MKTKIIDMVAQEVIDVFEDVLILKNTVHTDPAFEAWKDWSIEYMMNELSISKEKATYYFNKLTDDKERT